VQGCTCKHKKQQFFYKWAKKMNALVEVRAANTQHLVTTRCKGRLLQFDEMVGMGRNLARRFIKKETKRPKQSTIRAIEDAFDLEHGWFETDHGYEPPNLEGGDAPMIGPTIVKYIDMLSEERKKPLQEQNREIIDMCIRIISVREGVNTPCTCGGSLKTGS
jgi:hypothetical protein